MDIHAKQSLSQKQTPVPRTGTISERACHDRRRTRAVLQRELEDNPLLEPPEYTDSSFSEPFSLSGHGAPSEAPEHGRHPLPDRPSLRDHLLQPAQRALHVVCRMGLHAVFD